MRNTPLITLLAMTVAMPVFAQSAQETVTFTLQASQPSLFDSGERDTYNGTLDDRSGTTTLSVECSAGSSALMGLVRSDEACGVTGSGSIKNPNNPSESVQRVNIAGGYTIQGKKDGYTPMNTLTVNYVRVGSAGAETTTFGGSLTMMPENPSATALALGNSVIEALKQKAAGTGASVEYDTKIDSITFRDFVVPSVGLPGSVPCEWDGEWIYSYAAEGWQGAFDVTCGGTTYRLEGSMPLVPASSSGHDEEYIVNLIVPGVGGGDPFAAPDPFATVDGIAGTLNMSNSGRNTEDDVYETVSVKGELVGTGVPLEVVRGWGQIVTIFGRTFFGE